MIDPSGVYDSGKDLSDMWDAFERIRKHGLYHDDFVHPVWGFAALYRTMIDYEAKAYRERAVRFEREAG